MRHGSGSRRSRSRNNNGRRNGGGNPRTRTYDSNGPDVRIRGNAFQINEKYLALAKDAAAAGDTILAESYLQHAEHYQRLMNEALESQPQPKQQPENVAEDDVASNDEDKKSSKENLNNPVAGMQAEEEQPKKRTRKPRVKKEDKVEA